VRTFFFAAVLVGLCALEANAGPDVIIKQRAKDFRDQNNTQQGVPPPARPGAPANPPPVPPQRTAPPAQVPLTPQQQNVLKVKSDLASFKPGAEITADQKQQLVKDLTALAQSATKPSQTSVTKLASDLVSALSGKSIAAAEQTKLANDLAAIFNSANLSGSQIQTFTTDAQMVLQMSGVKREAALGIVADLKTIAAEVQRPTTK
jgi:hypothetical protein